MTIVLRYRVFPGLLAHAPSIAALEAAMTLDAEINGQANPNRSPLDLFRITPAIRNALAVTFQPAEEGFPDGFFLVTVRLDGGAELDQIAPTDAAKLPLFRNLYTSRISAATGARVVAEEPELQP